MTKMSLYWKDKQHGLALYYGDCIKTMASLSREFDLCFLHLPSDDPNVLAEALDVVPASRILIDTPPQHLNVVMSAVESSEWDYVYCLSCVARYNANAKVICQWQQLTSMVVVSQRPGATWDGQDTDRDWFELPATHTFISPTVATVAPYTICQILRTVTRPHHTVINPFAKDGSVLRSCYFLGRRCAAITSHARNRETIIKEVTSTIEAFSRTKDDEDDSENRTRKHSTPSQSRIGLH